MKINTSLFAKVASLILAGTLSASAIAQTDSVTSYDGNSEVISKNQNAYGNHAQSDQPELDMSKLSEQGKIKSSQLIIKFKEKNADLQAQILENFSVEKITDFYNPSKTLAAYKELFSKMKIVSFATGTNLTKVYSELVKSQDVEYVAPNHVFTLQSTTPNDMSNTLWGLNNTGVSRTFTNPLGVEVTETGTADADIDAPEAWDIIHDAENTVIAVIDTGIDYNHNELASNMWTNPGEIAGNGIDDDGNGYIDDVHGYDFADNDADPLDVLVITRDDEGNIIDSVGGHGTHCAGTIAAQGNNGDNMTGIVWNTKLMALKIFGDGERGAFTTDIVNAILYAADNGAKVSNNSYGAQFNNAVTAEIVQKPMIDAISAANDAGMLFVAAAGNSGIDLDGTTMSTPSDIELPNVISVAASDHNDELAAFIFKDDSGNYQFYNTSNFGKTAVDLAAPGHNILSTFPENQYKVYSGTSMATPHVAGAAALIREKSPELTAAEVKAILMNTVDKKETLADISSSGGRLNLHSALLALESSGGECDSFTASNDSHVSAQRAYTETSGQTCWGTFCYGGTTTYKAKGSDESLGSYGFTNTTLYENEPGVFSTTENCQTGGTLDAPPVLALNIPREKFITVGTQYTIPQGAVSAIDREDGDISASVTSSGSVDFNNVGRYIVAFNVTDSAGNQAAPVFTYINVTEYDTAPEISLIGPQCSFMWCEALFMETNTAYQEPGYIAIDLIDGDITDNVFIIDNPMGDTSEEGLRFLYYDAIDSAGNHARSASFRIAAVLDAEMPHIWVRPAGGLGEYLSYGNELTTWKRPDGDTSWYYSPSFAVFDLKTDFYSEDLVWEDHVSISGEDTVDFTQVGDYTVTFTATDLDGNTDIETQVIHVVEDITPPQITLWGDNTVYVEVGDFFYEPGGIAKDDLDRYPRTSMKYYDENDNEIDNPLNNRVIQEGSYKVEYLAVDGAGNQAESKFRTVHVVRSHWDHAPVFDGWSIRRGNAAEISGTTFDVDGDVNRVEVEFNKDGNWIAADFDAENQTFSYKPDFYGERDVRFRVVDDNGNMFTTDTYMFSSTAIITIDSKTLSINGNSITVTGSASHAEDKILEIQINVDDTKWITCSGTTDYSCSLSDLEPGQHYFQIRGVATDFRSHSATGRHYFDIANGQAPQIDDYSYEFVGNKLVVTGSASDADGDLASVHLLIGLGGSVCTGTTSFTCELSDLVDGTTYNVALQARDANGNESTPTEFSFTYEEQDVNACFTTTNNDHVSAGRAELRYNILVYANGSDTYLGMGSSTTSLQEESAGHWVKVDSCN